jgi:RimJ/RimL family protein N-acetyltransferase
MDKIVGTNVCLRLVQPADAAYLFQLRTDPALNTHLSQVYGTIADQEAWITSYKEREQAGAEFYFIIERLDQTPCGTVRLYNIEGNTFTWGSWMLDCNKPRKAAPESAMLSFGYAFETLNLKAGFVTVNIGNTHAEAFYRRFGMTELRRSDDEAFFVYSADLFNRQKSLIRDVLDQDTSVPTGVS